MGAKHLKTSKYSERKKERKRKKREKRKKMWKKIIIFFVILASIGGATLGFLLYGPYSSFRVWLITVVLKTSVGKTTAGSNPALSAYHIK